MRAFRAAAAQWDRWWGRLFLCGLSCTTATSSSVFNFTSPVSTVAQGSVVGLGVVERVRCGCSSTDLRHSLVVGKVDQDRVPVTSAHETTPLITHDQTKQPPSAPQSDAPTSQCRYYNTAFAVRRACDYVRTVDSPIWHYADPSPPARRSNHLKRATWSAETCRSGPQTSTCASYVNLHVRLPSGPRRASCCSASTHARQRRSRST